MTVLIKWPLYLINHRLPLTRRQLIFWLRNFLCFLLTNRFSTGKKCLQNVYCKDADCEAIFVNCAYTIELHIAEYMHLEIFQMTPMVNGAIRGS